MSDAIGVVAMIHGSAESLDDDSLRDYLGRIMRGRSPSQQMVDDLRGRYEAIGGTGLLMERSREQVAQLQAQLGDEFRVVLGAKHAPPFVSDGVAGLADAGASRIVGIALAPHEATLTTTEYDRAGAEAAYEAGLPWTMVRSWHLAPDLIELWAELLGGALTSVGETSRVLFSAHSLPAAAAGPYPSQVAETAEAVAARLALDPPAWEVVFQSVPPGADPSTWLGPNLADSYPDGGRAVVAPIGFVSDHLEVLFDIDVQARAEAAAQGVVLTRTRLPNGDPRLARAMASAIRSAA